MHIRLVKKCTQIHSRFLYNILDSSSALNLYPPIFIAAEISSSQLLVLKMFKTAVKGTFSLKLLGTFFTLRSKNPFQSYTGM